jgi:hypothetical protein
MRSVKIVTKLRAAMSQLLEITISFVLIVGMIVSVNSLFV